MHHVLTATTWRKNRYKSKAAVLADIIADKSFLLHQMGRAQECTPANDFAPGDTLNIRYDDQRGGRDTMVMVLKVSDIAKHKLAVERKRAREAELAARV